VLFPYNFTMMSDPAYRADAEELITRCRERRVAMQSIKSIARRRGAADDVGPHFSWYGPQSDGDALERAVRFVLSRDGLFLNTSSDLRLLESALAAASAASLTAPSDDEMAADVAAQGIRPLFDGAELERI
jgi:hypothetical protein